jgi:hypothetical protein
VVTLKSNVDEPNRIAVGVGRFRRIHFRVEGEHTGEEVGFARAIPKGEK